MNITLTSNKIAQDTKFLAFEKNNGVDVINITVDTDEEWTYKLDVKYPNKCCSGEQLYNIIDLTRTGNSCTAVLTKDMLPFTGKYMMQLRAISGDKVYHSDTFDAWVKYSIEPASTYDPVPSEFYQIEDNITEINNNPPKPGENGYWLIWDAVTHQYKESAIPLPDGTLPEVTADTSGKYLSNDGKKAYWAEVQTGTESKIDKIEVNNVEQPIIDKTVNIAVPTKTSDLSNDSGYITNEALNSYATKAELPTKVSQLENDSKFINESALNGYAKTADIPTKTSQLNNDSGYITANDAPVKSVNTKTGAVVLTQDDVGDGATYVRTHNDFTDALKTQINTNEDNIAMAESDIEGLQTTVGTLKTNVTSLQTALTSKQDVIVGAASTITDNNLVADRALISNSSGKVAVSNVTSTELGYLDGVTSNVQTQLNKKLEKAPVISVNSKTGAVQLNASDVSAIPSTLTGTAGQVLTKTADGQEWRDVDIPTALPNPNALTFTGAVTGSYDGSSPMSVKIPSGGDAEKRVRHIATVSVTAGTTSYSVTVDSNGDALNLESVYILTEKFWGDGGSYVQVKINKKEVARAYGASGSPQAFAFEKMGELQKFTNIPKPSDVGISFGDYYNGKSAVTSVDFWAATSKVDTTIEIYGVDA